jgi:hypothetical protein
LPSLRVKDFLRLGEIERDPALRIYGAILAALGVLSYLHWTLYHPISEILRPDTYRVCWPFLSDCNWMRLEPAAFDVALHGWLALCVVAALLFLPRATWRWAWLLLVVVTVAKQWIVFGDYRLRLNQHYMSLWVAGAFLFVAPRRRVLPYLVIFFYVWAALLKLGPDWMSGNWVYDRTPLGMPQFLVPAASVYVVILELVIVWGLLARRTSVFALTLAQLVLFHVASWNVVGFFYPLLMLGILSLFPLLRWIPDPEETRAGEPPTLRLLATAAEARPVMVTLAVFSMLQLAPLLYPGDTSLTGEGRWLSLHMFDAPVRCTGVIRYHEFSGEVVEHVVEPGRLYLMERIRCDPLVYYSAARRSCEVNRERKRYSDIDVELRSARKGQPERTIVSIENFCQSAPRYVWWRHNDWIGNGG